MLIWRIVGFPIRCLFGIIGLLVFVLVKCVEPDRKFKDFWNGKLC